MAYEDVVLLVSFGWFLSLIVILLMYLRLRKLSQEVKALKKSVFIEDEGLAGHKKNAV